MKIVNIISRAVTDAVEHVVERNSIQAQQNRLKMVMRNEADLTQRAYIELGKYYYENLRGKEESERNEVLCDTIDNSKYRMNKAVDRYKELMIQQDKIILNEDIEEDCNIDEIAEDITLCCAYDKEEKAEEKAEQTEE